MLSHIASQPEPMVRGWVRRIITLHSWFAALPIVLFLHATTTWAQTGLTSDGNGTTTQYARPAAPSEPGPASAVPPAPKTPDICDFHDLPQCLKDIGNDQIGLWSSPARVKAKDAIWLAPFAVTTAIAFRFDGDASQDLGFDPKVLSVSNKVSDVGSSYATFGFGGALWTIGTLTHHDHFAETGRLGLEALADAFLVDETMKLATNRQRPYQNLVERGEFWEDGTKGMAYSSFPSGHAITTWALARVVAEEYPNWWVRLGAYSAATVVSVARVTGQDHFPSDVLVGGTLGYLIGGYVVRHHASGSQGLIVAANPIVNAASRTYGMQLEFRPQELNRKIAKLLRLPPAVDGTISTSPEVAP